MTRHEQAIERARDSLITVVYSADGPFSPKGQVLNLAARDAVVALMEAAAPITDECPCDILDVALMAGRADMTEPCGECYQCALHNAMDALADVLGVPE